jgi:hypothetical protein
MMPPRKQYFNLPDVGWKSPQSVKTMKLTIPDGVSQLLRLDLHGPNTATLGLATVPPYAC